MDLLGDLGVVDQLTAARSENAVLQNKVKELLGKVQTLTFEKAALQAEVELYRKEAANVVPTFSALALGDTGSRMDCTEGENYNSDDMLPAFFQSGGSNNANGNANNAGGLGPYCRVPDVVLNDWHGAANPVCVALSADETVLVTGGADGAIRFAQWGAAVAVAAASAENNTTTTEIAMQVPAQHTATLSTTAPIICLAAANHGGALRGTMRTTVAAGTMDGRVLLAVYETTSSSSSNSSSSSSSSGSQLTATFQDAPALQRHAKYLTAVCWNNYAAAAAGSSSSNSTTLATSSADGDIYLYTVTAAAAAAAADCRMDEDDNTADATAADAAKQHQLSVTHVHSLHLDGAVTCMCFGGDNKLYAHVRGTPHLTVIHVPSSSSSSNNNNNDYKVTKIHLNASASDDHVSFAVLCLKASPDGRYLAAATDTSRHIILDVTTTAANNKNKNNAGKILRNLYGHAADCHSSPVIAWSANGQYLYSNTQDSSKLLVYEIASGKLIDPNTTTYSEQQQQQQQQGTTEMQQPHHRPVKDIFSSPGSDLLVTTSFDRKIVIWFPKTEL